MRVDHYPLFRFAVGHPLEVDTNPHLPSPASPRIIQPLLSNGVAHEMSNLSAQQQ